ncbi:MAG: hypothetical protein AB8I08_20780 [Sandaracinaceae bacterium]
MEAGPPDAGPIESGPVDAGPLDAGPLDAGPLDAGPVDAGPDPGPLGLSVIATLASPATVRVQGIEAADTTSAYLVGYFDGELTIPGDATIDTEVRRGFLLRMDTSGAVPWSHVLEGRLANGLEQVDGDNTGVVVAGTFREQVSIAGGRIETGDDSDTPDVLVAALLPDGGFRWSAALTSPETLTTSALRRWHDRVRMGGQYRGTVADAMLPTASTLDAYVVTLSAGTGAIETSRSFALSSPGRDDVFAIEPSDPTSEAAYWVAGEHGGTSDAGVIGVLGEPTRSRDGFVHSRRVATDEEFWGITIGGSSSDLVTGLARISNSEVVLGMTASGNIMTGGESGGLSGGLNVGVVQRRGGDQGTVIDWTRLFGEDGGGVEVVDVVAQGGSVWVAGTFTTATDFGLGSVAVTGSRDSFLVELAAADGSTLNVHQIQGVMDEVVTDIDIDTAGNVWVSGWFTGRLDRPGDTPLEAMGVDGFVARVRVP